jgi:hypothetical protein
MSTVAVRFRLRPMLDLRRKEDAEAYLEAKWRAFVRMREWKRLRARLLEQYLTELTENQT